MAKLIRSGPGLHALLAKLPELLRFYCSSRPNHRGNVQPGGKARVGNRSGPSCCCAQIKYDGPKQLVSPPKRGYGKSKDPN
jgi:hypothetical protein